MKDKYPGGLFQFISFAAELDAQIQGANIINMVLELAIQIQGAKI